MDQDLTGLEGLSPGARIVVAMSGGVDSSRRRGAAGARRAMTSSASRCSFTITARAVERKGACCAGEDIHDARRVAERSALPHYVLDYEARFRKTVMEDFARRLCARRDARSLRALQRDA